MRFFPVHVIDLPSWRSTALAFVIRALQDKRRDVFRHDFFPVLSPCRREELFLENRDRQCIDHYQNDRQDKDKTEEQAPIAAMIHEQEIGRGEKHEKEQEYLHQFFVFDTIFTSKLDKECQYINLSMMKKGVMLY